MSELLNEVNRFELDEGFSPKEIKMAIGIASDPRYKGGNMTGATNAIDKIKKGLSDHPKVAAVLRRQNEDFEEKEEGFSSDAQRRAAFASGYKEKGKKKKEEEIDETMEDEFGERKAPKVDPAKFAAFMDKKKKPKRMSSTQKALSSISKRADKMSREETDLDNEDESCYIDEDSQSRMKDSAIDALHKLVQSKGSKASLGSHAFTIAKSYENLNGRELEKMYVDKHGIPEEDVKVIEGYFPEAKSSTGYELFHNTLGGAIETAVSHAKSKFGISISDEERMDKVGMGPRKPSKGKTNSYRLMGTDKSGKSKGVQVQVYNMGNKFELNMYKESVDEEVEIDEAISMKGSVMQYYYVDPKGVVQAVGSKDAMRKMNVKQAKDGNKGGSFSQNLKKYKVGDKIKEEIDEASKEGTIKIIDLGKGKGFQVQRMTKGKFVNQGKPYKSAKDAEKVRKDGQHSMQFETIEDANALAMELGESVKFAGMPAGLSKARIKADRDVYAQVLGIKEAIDPADFDIRATGKDKEQADKNVLIQLSKVITLKNAHKGVEFADGSKQKVHPNVAAAALSMHQKLRRTDQKDAFQNKIGKSYKDLLNAVKGK